MSTITLSADECDVILEQLWRWDGEDDGPLPFGTRQEAIASLAALHRAFDLREELGGWPDADTATSQGQPSYTATVTPELIELLREASIDAADSLAYEREGLKLAKAGNRDQWFTDTLEETIEIYEKQMRRHEHERAACDAVLARLDAAEAVMA